ncbi:unnamed protein product [Symbiodinium sp. CCMP2592]|nr:unnamed protein product [Symbiodinium sp. CCMP2592]
MDDTPSKNGASQLSQLWEANATVRRRAATYVMVKLPPSGRIDRACVELNEEVLTPIVQELGARVGVDVLEEHVYSLYKLMKMALSSAQASALAWSLKRLVSVFKRSISRPHRPRSPVIRNIMQAAGIPVPAPTADDDESTDYHEDGDEGEEEEELEVDPPMDIELKPEDAIEDAAKADAPLLTLAPPLKKARTKSLEEGSAEAGAGPLKPVPTEPEQAVCSEHASPTSTTAPVPEHRPPTDPSTAPAAMTTAVVPAGTITDATPPEPNDGGRGAHKARMKKLRAILESGKKAKQDVEAGRSSGVHVVVLISEDVAECQACGLTGSIDMFNTMECSGARLAKIRELERLREFKEQLIAQKRQRLYELEKIGKKASDALPDIPSNRTDNLETQAWMEDAQPPYDPLCKSLSFEEAMDECEPLSDPDPLLSVGGPTRETLPSRKEKTEACDKGQEKPEASNKGHTKPEAGDKDQENPKACDKGLDKVPAHSPKKALKPEASLPAKPACMHKIPASMSPDEQMGRKAKCEKETAEADEEEEEQEEGEEDVEMGEGSQDDEDECEEDLDGEEMEEEEQDGASDEEKPAKRPAAKIAMKKAPKAKAKASSKGRGKGGAKGKPKAKGKAKGKAKAKSSPKAPKKKTDDEMKKVKSRKSVAYHKARAEALSAGMSVEEASEIGKEATCLNRLHPSLQRCKSQSNPLTKHDRSLSKAPKPLNP